MYSPTSNLFLAQPVAEFFNPDTVQRHTLGTLVQGVDPFWGPGMFVYGKAAAAQEMGSVCRQSDVGVMSDYPATTQNLGQNLFSAIHEMAADEFGWYQCVGNMVLSASASVAADAAFGLTTAGQVGANNAGRQVLGGRVVKASTATVAKSNCTVTNASNVIFSPNGIAGWFHGITLSGTGIPASSEITSFDPDQHTVTMSENATANGTVTVTGTYTGFIVANCSHPHSQGAIT